MAGQRRHQIAGVHRSEDFGVFICDSLTDDVATYRVDMEEYQGNGECDCWNFRSVCKPHLDRGAFPAPHLQCKHIKRVLFWLWIEHHNAIIQLERALREHTT